jgi:hypothetical protein
MLEKIKKGLIYLHKLVNYYLMPNLDKQSIDGFLNLNNDFKKYLDASSKQMIADLKDILLDTSIKYNNGKSREDILVIYFEYEYDHLDIVFLASDKKTEIIAEVLTLPTVRKSKLNDESEWDSFFPEIISNKVDKFKEKYNTYNIGDVFDKYNRVKYSLFEEWFCSCWTMAVLETNVKMDAYFSIHDTIYLTDLSTLKGIKEEDIMKKFF